MSREFGKKLKILREQQGLYQKDIALEFGVAPNTVSQWESGISEPNIEQITRLAELLNTDTNNLLGNESKQSELERKLIQAGLKDKINNLSDKQYDALVTLIDNLIADKDKKN